MVNFAYDRWRRGRYVQNYVPVLSYGHRTLLRQCPKNIRDVSDNFSWDVKDRNVYPDIKIIESTCPIVHRGIQQDCMEQVFKEKEKEKEESCACSLQAPRLSILVYHRYFILFFFPTNAASSSCL